MFDCFFWQQGHSRLSHSRFDRLRRNSPAESQEFGVQLAALLDMSWVLVRRFLFDADSFKISSGKLHLNAEPSEPFLMRLRFSFTLIRFFFRPFGFGRGRAPSPSPTPMLSAPEELLSARNPLLAPPLQPPLSSKLSPFDCCDCCDCCCFCEEVEVDCCCCCCCC